MKSFFNIVSVEIYKSYKSKTIWLTALAFTMLPVMGGFFMYVLKNPDFAERIGLIGAKAQLAGSADWPSFLGLLAQGIAVGGLFVYGFITSWVFGREYTDRTVKDLLAMPFPRSHIPIAKFLTIILWSFVLTAWVIGAGFLIGMTIGLPLWSTAVWQDGIYVLSVTTLLTIFVSTPVAFFACIGKGYLAPLGFIVITLILSQVIAVIGYGSYFPWAVPALFSNISGTGNLLNASSLFLVILAGLLGVAGTLGFWRYADQHL
ncbi:ABC transporter permease [Sediminibacillus halophilus]|uniref:ABC-2 type transport system permease protein n=1 Tax=Sediminibacillus halophilus TaxID=482461 RepID=A0A1G9NFK2_9BACI|nr:ABC transporter permease [Sediminibacillus halophilus]SDL85101.1 ABC-2 type transport system permease protein [Sediminibacillus halophilus]